MGYRIAYGETAVKTAITDSKPKRFPVKTICTAVLIGTLLIPQVHMMVRDLILPGDSEVTAAAVDGLLEDLRAGERVEDAVTVFCREIIGGGT